LFPSHDRLRPEVNAGGTITTATGLAVLDIVGAGTVTNQTGVVVAELTKGTNNTSILLGTTTVPAGDWCIYQSDDYNSRLNGQLSMNTHRITDVVDPVDAQDVATKAWVEAQIAAIP